jgi:DNA-binding response OmpR family regulator
MILLLCDDLLDASKTIAHGRAAGATVVQCQAPDSLLQRTGTGDVSCCIVDLHCPGLDVDALLAAVARLEKRPRVIAYGSHVDAARLSAARKAGCDEVLPRSTYFAQMPARIGSWAG